MKSIYLDLAALPSNDHVTLSYKLFTGVHYTFSRTLKLNSVQSQTLNMFYITTFTQLQIVNNKREDKSLSSNGQV